MSVLRKDPDVDKTFGNSWASYLGTLTITASEWDLPPGITEGPEGSSFTTTATQIQLSGGTDGEDYEILNRITLSNDDTEERTIVVQVREASWKLTDDELVTLSEAVREDSTTAAAELTVNEVASVRADLTTWATIRDSHVKLKGGSSGVDFDNARKRAAIFYRLRQMLGFDFISYDLDGDVLQLVELEVGASFG